MEDINVGTYGMGGRIAAIRKAKGWTQAQLAEKMDVSIQAVSKWETGASWPDVTTLPRLAQVLGVSIDWLFGRDEKDPDPEEVFKEAEVKAQNAQTEKSVNEEPTPDTPKEEAPDEAPHEEPPVWESREEGAKAGLELQLNGVTEVTVLTGTSNRWTWEFEGDPDLQELVEIRTQAYHLKLVDRTASDAFSFFGFRGLFNKSRELKVTLYAPAEILEDVHVRKRGAAKLTIEPMIEFIDLTSGGAGDLKFHQIADGVIASSGVGDLKIHELDSCEIKSGGVGDLKIDQITGRLNVTQSGVGDIKIKKGYIEDLILKKSGVGDFRAPDVEVISCDLSVSGVGNVRLGTVREVRRQHTSGIADVKFNSK